MNKIILSLVSLLMISGIFIQTRTYGQDDEEMQKRRKEFMNVKGKISGKVYDKETDKPLESASVQLFRQKDSSFVLGVPTKKDGSFLIEDIRGGMYKVLISYIGYSSAYINRVLISPKEPEVDLGKISLEPGSEMTKEIEVTADIPFMKTDIDKKVFNVEKSMVSESGSAADVLKNIPSVTVDADGKISLRGSGNIKILINGKPSNFLGSDPIASLEQIPANAIETIEIMTNPSAKYDPESMAGIINIIFKKSKQEESGYNGNISLNTGTKDKYNASVNLNVKQNSLSMFGNYNYRNFTFTGDGYGSRTTYYNNSSFLYNQNSNFRGKMKSHLGTLGLDYDINKFNNINLSATYSNRKRNRNEQGVYKNFNTAGTLTNLYERYNYDDETENNFDINLGYKKKFDKPKQELNALFLYSLSKENEIADNTQQNFNPDYTPANNTPYLQNDNTDDNRHQFTIQVDYYHPLKEDKSRFEVGYKSMFNYIKSDYLSEYYDYNSNQWLINNFVSNKFDYNQSVHSLYGIFANKYKDFGYQFGLRLEQTFRNFTLETTSESYKKNYFSYFPSVFLSQMLSKTNEVQASYTRRINRPGGWSLNPFINNSDPQNLRKGNPYLNPEYINSFELNYVKYFPTVSLTGSVFYKHINDVINRIITVIDSSTSLMTFDNVAKAQSYGVELAASGTLFRFWNFNANWSYFRTEVSGSTGGAELNNDNYSWTAKLMFYMVLPNIFDIQLSYYYQGKMVTIQGEMDPMQSLDIALKKDFFDKRFTVLVRATDIFNTMKFKGYAVGTNFSGETSRKRESQTVFLTLSYKFGKEFKVQGKRKKMREENNDNGMDEF